MLIDENGQPYIAHAGMLSNAASGARQGVGRGVRQVHKYIMKIGEGAQARYFYTQDEIRAYQQEMANRAKGMTEQAKNAATKVGNKVNDAADTYVTGKYAKSKRDMLRSQAAREKDNSRAEHLNVDADAYDRNYKRSIAGKAEAVSNKVQSEAQRFKSNQQARREMKKYLNENKKPWMTATVTDREGNKTVYKNGQALKETGKTVGKVAAEVGRIKAEQVANNVKSASERMKDEFRKKKEEATNKIARKAYNAQKTVEKAKDEVRYSSNNIAGKARDKIDEATDKVVKKAADVSNDAQKVAEKAKDAASNAANKVKDTASKAVETAKDKAGFDERQRKDEAWRNIGKQAMGSEDREKAWDEFRKAENEYSKTALGKLENADYKAAEKIDDAVWNTINKLNIKGKDVHDRYSAAREEERRNPTEENKRKAEELWDEYLKTPHAKLAFSTSGIVENGVAGNAGRLASNAASKIKDISESQAKKIRQKLNSGADVAQEDLRALWRYYSNK